MTTTGSSREKVGGWEVGTRVLFQRTKVHIHEILTITHLEIEIPDTGVDYLLLGPSGSGKSIFLRTLYALLNGSNVFDVPGNTPCSISGVLDKHGDFRVSFGDEWGSQIAVNQFERGYGIGGPKLDFRIAHDFVSIDIHRRRRMPLIFISQGEVIYSGSIEGFMTADIEVIQNYITNLHRK